MKMIGKLMRIYFQQQKKHIRADYEDLLELMIVFLGGVRAKGVHFRPSIALDSARFTGPITYCLTIHMFAFSG